MDKLAKLGRYAVPPLALVLMVLAVLLPARLSQWQDRQLLDVPHIIEKEAREGFAESVQLTVGEKLLLLRSGSLARMPVDGMEVRGIFTLPAAGEGASGSSIEHTDTQVTVPGPEQQWTDKAANAANASASAGSDPDLSPEQVEEALQQWDKRLLALWGELRTLQSMGALPELWEPGTALEFLGQGETLYMDADTGMSCRVYSLFLSVRPYSLLVNVDAQSGRIFSFVLSWTKDVTLNWGFRGASNFGSAWRDYWGMDSVSSAWYSSYIQEILESGEESVRKNGTYNHNGQINFSYDGQGLSISLSNWASTDRGGSLVWNT